MRAVAGQHLIVESLPIISLLQILYMEITEKNFQNRSKGVREKVGQIRLKKANMENGSKGIGCPDEDRGEMRTGKWRSRKNIA